MVNYITNLLASMVASNISESNPNSNIGKIANRATNALSRSNDSITKRSIGKSIVFPFVTTRSMPQNVVNSLVKYSEHRLALDIKNIIEKDDVFDELMSRLNIPTLDGGLGSRFARNVEAAARSFTEANMDGLAPAKLLKMDALVEAPSVLVDRDRSALPTTVVVKVKYQDNNGTIRFYDHIINIECIPRYVDSLEFQSKIAKYNPNRMFKRFIQLTNKEISFIRDFLLDLDLIKEQAKSASSGVKNIFSQIERNQKVKDMGLSTFPFLVLGITEEFKNMVLQNESFDIEKQWKTILEKFFALGIYIYDDNTDCVSYGFDGYTNLVNTTLSELEKESSKTDKAIARLNKLI